MAHLVDERWKPVVGFPKYEVSDQGRVRRVETGYVLKLKFDRRCYYLLACMSAYPKVHERPVHQLVAHAFIGLQRKGIEVRHLNGNPVDNWLPNLAYGTKSDNIKDAIRHGTFPVLERRPGAKLTKEKAIAIFTSSDSSAVLAKRYGVGIGVIRQVKMRETWRSVTASLPNPIWKFKPKLTGDQLRIVLDRSITRQEVMAQLGLKIHQVKYYRKINPVPKRDFRDRFSPDEWLMLCDRATPVREAVTRLGVSTSYVKSVRRSLLRSKLAGPEPARPGDCA